MTTMVHHAEVVRIDKATAEKIIVAKHYSHRGSIFWEAYGLVIHGYIAGVVVYGQPSPIQRCAFKDRDFKLYELGRLVIQTKMPNAASILVGRSLKMLDNYSAVVSYADTEFGHAGIVYQATNWIYTGATKSHDHVYMVDGKRVHPMTLRDRGITNPKMWAKQNGIQTVAPSPKHRYFYLNGSRKQKKVMLSRLAYPIIDEYPKLDKSMYDSGPDVIIKLPVEKLNG